MERKIADPWTWQGRRGFVQTNEVSRETKPPFVDGPSEIEALVERIVEIATGCGVEIPSPPPKAQPRKCGQHQQEVGEEQRDE